jgi:hypothetical protein
MTPQNLRLRDAISRINTEYGDVILDERTGRYWHANPTAVIILDTVAQGGTTEDAVRRIVAEFAVDADIARDDVEILVARLRQIGVLA